MNPRLTQANFSHGELGPQLYGRFDVDAYSAALKSAQNVFVLKYGGICKRPGMMLVAEVLDASAGNRLIPFQFSLSQGYALEMGNLYVSPCTAGGRVLEGALAITGITAAAQAQMAVAAHGYAVGDKVYIASVAGDLGHLLNGRFWPVVAVPDANHVAIGANTAAVAAFTPGGTVARAYKAATPYGGDELAELDYVENNDDMYFAHLLHAPGVLVRSGHTSWAHSTLTFGSTLSIPGNVTAVAQIGNTDSANSGLNYYPFPQTYAVTAYSDDTGQESRSSLGNPTGAIDDGTGTGTIPTYVTTVVNDLTLKRNFNVIRWDAVPNATRYRVYKAENSQFFGYIGTTQTLSFRDDNIGPDLTQAPPAAYNPFDAAGDYPSTVELHEQRLIWARSTNIPNGVWTSRSAQPNNMDKSQPTREDDSVTFAIMSGDMSEVNQLCSTTKLVGLTSGGIYDIDGDGQGGILKGNNPPSAKRQNRRAASRLKPIMVDNVVFYTPAVGASVRTIGYDFSIDGLKTNDVSIYSPHFFLGFTIVDWAFTQEPRALIWAARDDGALLCFTWEQEQNVWGWTICETDGKVLSVCTVTEEGEDRLYLLVERVVNGQTRRFVERLAPHLWSDITDCCFLDCAIQATFDTPQSTFYGLWHLEGRTDVAGLVDGFAVTGLTVTNGSLTLPDTISTASKVTFGIPYTAVVETLPIRLNQQGTGSNVGRSQQPGEVVLSLQDSRSVLAGIDADHLFLVKQRLDEKLGAPDALMNGDYIVSMDNKAGQQASVYIQQTAPLPLTVLGISVDPIING
jgi:hypothetical protein